MQYTKETSRTLHGCVDWNTDPLIRKCWCNASHPSWVRGLKFTYLTLSNYVLSRTLHGCVDWNLKLHTYQLHGRKSHPSWVRGLKLTKKKEGYWLLDVAPFMGAWIEIKINLESAPDREGRTLHGCVDWNKGICIDVFKKPAVAPFMGAWIEMPLIPRKLLALSMSHPSWVRGLKYSINPGLSQPNMVVVLCQVWVQVKLRFLSISYPAIKAVFFL